MSIHSINSEIRCMVSGYLIGTYSQKALTAGQRLAEAYDSPGMYLHGMRHPLLRASLGDYKRLPEHMQYAILVNTLLNHGVSNDLDGLELTQRKVSQIGSFIEREGEGVFTIEGHQVFFDMLYYAMKTFGRQELCKRFTLELAKLKTHAPSWPDAISLEKVLSETVSAFESGRFVTGEVSGWIRRSNVYVEEKLPKKPMNPKQKQKVENRQHTRYTNHKRKVGIDAVFDKAMSDFNLTAKLKVAFDKGAE